MQQNEHLKRLFPWQYDAWNNEERCLFFEGLLNRSNRKQLFHLQTVMDKRVVVDRIDFTTIFPRFK